MPCNMANEWQVGSAQNLLQAPNVSDQCESTCIDLGDRVFFYSNYPEKLLTEYLTNGVLWSHGDILDYGQQSIKYRCFLWHINRDSQPVYAALTLHNASANTIHATNGSGVMFTDDGTGNNPPPGFPAPFVRYADFREGGRCIAQSMLARSLDPVPSLFVHVPPGQTSSILQWGPLAPDKTYGVYVEFNLGAQVGDGWLLREVFARSAADLLTRTAVWIPLSDLSGGGGDGRGNWPTDMIRIKAPVLEISGPAVSHRIHCAATYDSPPDNCFPVEQAGVKGSKGKYGVVYADQGSYPGIILPYRIQPNTRAGTVEAWLTGGAVSGEGQYFDFFGSAGSMTAGGRPVPMINVNQNEAVLLYTVPIPANQPLINDAALISVAVAGAATTPFDVVLRWV